MAASHTYLIWAYEGRTMVPGVQAHSVHRGQGACALKPKDEGHGDIVSWCLMILFYLKFIPLMAIQQ